MIGYRRGDQHFYRSMPAKVAQTGNTRRAAHNFGVASRKGRLIRSAFAADMDVNCDGSAGNRLNGMLVRAGRNNPGGIAGFQFNRYAGTDKFFPVSPVFTKDGKLHIAKQHIIRHEGIDALEVKVIAARISFSERRVISTDATELHIDLEKAFEGAVLEVDAPGNGVLVVTLQIRGFSGGSATGNRKYQSADIIAVMEPVTERVHHRMLAPVEMAWMIKRDNALDMALDAGKAKVIQRE